ncbi:hypothetical protein SK069_14855 [Patulibacter brassicae]|jgi:hypothetical protein|uniref:Ribosomal protein L7/L12 C-terminal domain-containing protein n=1 Tax=Patulibacter brassicae TaxID=1705717 RepID=A0ABU4VMM5_9ACTN|nr:hypothetical protein [Patulibacter brassicae]MDX8152879.1 hypothetical protein [Patulibacter brassicae]
MAIPKTTAQPSRRSLLRRIRALEARLEEIGDEPAGVRATDARSTGVDPATEVQELLASGRPMAAMRRYRELTGADEAAARAYIARHGGLDASAD